MWWSKQTQSATPSFSSTFSSTATIDSPIEAPASRFTGTGADRVLPQDTTPRDDLRIDAVMQDSISLNCRRLTIGETAKARAEVVAQEVIIYGELSGHLEAAKRIEIKKHASVMGHLTTPRIVIEDGAYFKGTVQIERRRTPRNR